jgi:hypothetical protein
LNRRGVPDGDMPNRPQPPDWGPPPFGDGDLDELAHSLWGVEDILTALRAGPGYAELTGETRALAEFRRVHRRPRHRRRRRTVPATLIAAAAAAALVAVAVCGAAAEAGRLPSPIQNLAHVVFAAPRPVHIPSAHARPHSDVDPHVSWSQACQGYQKAIDADRKPWLESGYGPLVSAAQGSGKSVGDYCADRDFPRGPSYPGRVADTGTDQQQGSWPGTRDSSPDPDGGAGPGRGPGPGASPAPSPGPSTSPSDTGPWPGAGPSTGPGGGASSGGTAGSGSDPTSSPGQHYPGAGSLPGLPTPPGPRRSSRRPGRRPRPGRA